MVNVLIVDDSPADREMIRRSLLGEPLRNGETCAITEAGSGSEAMAAYQDSRPDCVILDYRLPDVSGLDLLREFAPYGLDMAPPIIVVTGHGSEEVAANTVRLGVNDYLTKDKLSRESIRRAVDIAMERHRVGRQLERYHAALERSNADLATFAARLSHDLRSPINYVKGYSEMLTLEPDMPAEKRTEYINNIAEGIDRMDRMIHALYEFSNVQNDGGLAGSVGLNDVFEDVRKIMAERLLAEGATLRLPNDAPNVAGDRGLLMLLMQNLIGNALKYRRAENPMIEVQTFPRGDRIVVAVADNGIGIPETQRDKVFQMFYRVKSDRVVEGSGIGLATCRRIVERHEGTIWCDSAPEGGTVFYFTLPPAV